MSMIDAAAAAAAAAASGDTNYAFMAFVIAQAALVISVVSYLRPAGGKYCMCEEIERRDRKYLETLQGQHDNAPRARVQ